MTINNKFAIGDRVFLVTDQDQLPRIVSGITIRNGVLIYLLSQNVQETGHYEFEISDEKRYNLY